MEECSQQRKKINSLNGAKLFLAIVMEVLIKAIENSPMKSKIPNYILGVMQMSRL